ncbi:MAG TPA: arginine--tRNA ligase [Candidatus Paceibacterota bacterium]|nr:arginine--tRNA ligase [Verrucomicrobiota bacterium]HRY52205.1 arginine--tRNA ligase [Candidatus Paceibacterota bacterium]
MYHLSIERRLREVVTSVLPDANPNIIGVRPCPDPRFGDYQTTALMALAKERKMNPRALAADVVRRLDVSEWCEPVEIAGAGFLNFRIKTSALDRVLETAARGEHLFLQKAPHPRKVLLDFSSPNVAKAMHVGHIRSTVLGDCLARIFRLLGHTVITDNHIGDWGTQFGKLLIGWKSQRDPAALQRDAISEMERLYKTVHSACEKDPALLEQARQELVKLQDGDPENLAIWREMIALSEKQFDALYQRLGVRFDHTLGESFYNPQLKSLVQTLADLGIARKSEGAIAVFFEDVPELKDHTALIQKSDGAANYATTDLATLEYRWETWKPDEVIYVTDGRQQLHFKQVFTIFRRWHPEASMQLVHVWFGAILGPDGKPFKTRSGETIRLADLLDEAEERAYQVVSQKNPELNEPQRREIARIVGLGAVKYADLLPNRQSDYVFDWDKMLALNGNTAPYLQYAYTRIRSIFRKAESDPGATPSADSTAVALSAPEEIQLAKHLLNFGLVLEAAAEECRPNYLCNYLYDLAGAFARFYESCPVLKAEARQRYSRLVLCDLAGRVLCEGLGALGIETTELM